MYRSRAVQESGDAVKLAVRMTRVKLCHFLTSVCFPGYDSRLKRRLFLQSNGVHFVPRIASAAKNMRKSRAATVRNRAQRSALRTALKKAGTSGATAAQKREAIQLLDRTARKGLIHKNSAARHKSRLMSA